MSELVDQIAKLEATANKLKDSVSIDNQPNFCVQVLLDMTLYLKVSEINMSCAFLPQNA